MLENFVCTSIVENGPFQGCWETMDRETGDFHYIKMIDRSTLDTPKKVDNFSVEMTLLQTLNDTRIPKLIAFFNDQTSFYVVIEKPKFPSLFEKIKHNGPLPEKDARNFAISFIEVIQYLETIDPLLPWNISFETIYLNPNGSIGQIYISHTDSQLISLSEFASSRTMAPEMITHKRFSSKCFSWFLGVMLYFIVGGIFPFDGKSVKEILQNVLNLHPRFPAYLSKECSNFISLLLIKNPQMRNSIEKAADAPFVNAAHVLLSSDDELTFRRAFSSSKSMNIPSKPMEVKSLPKPSRRVSMNIAHRDAPHSLSNSPSGDFSIPKIPVSRVPSLERISITPRKFVSPLQSFGVRRVFNSAPQIGSL